MTVGPILGERDVRIDRPHELNEFVVDDLDDLLAGVEGAQHFLADGALRDLGDEVLGDGEVDVGFQQGLAHFLHGFTDVGFRDAAAAAQLFQSLGEAALDAFKHTASLNPPARRKARGKHRAFAGR